MSPRDHLGDLEALVLTAVFRLGGDSDGMSIYREIEERAGRDPSVPAVHVTLRRLEDKGFVASSVGSSSSRGGRPRRYYSLTPHGSAKLQAYREMWRGMWDGVVIPRPEGRS